MKSFIWYSILIWVFGLGAWQAPGPTTAHGMDMGMAIIPAKHEGRRAWPQFESVHCDPASSECAPAG